MHKLIAKGRLVVVLYENGGCVFTDQTLQSLRITAEKVADEVVPPGSDLPKRKDVVVLWLNRSEGLCVACSEGESDVSEVVRSQPWAQLLLSRSGRWKQGSSL